MTFDLLPTFDLPSLHMHHNVEYPLKRAPKMKENFETSTIIGVFHNCSYARIYTALSIMQPIITRVHTLPLAACKHQINFTKQATKAASTY